MGRGEVRDHDYEQRVELGSLVEGGGICGAPSLPPKALVHFGLKMRWAPTSDVEPASAPGPAWQRWRRSALCCKTRAKAAWCHVMSGASCHVASCHVASCRVMSYQDMSCCDVADMSCPVMSHHCHLCHVMSRRVVLRHVISGHVLRCNAAPCRVMSGHVASRHLCHVGSRRIMSTSCHVM